LATATPHRAVRQKIGHKRRPHLRGAARRGAARDGILTRSKIEMYTFQKKRPHQRGAARRGAARKKCRLENIDKVSDFFRAARRGISSTNHVSSFRENFCG